MIFFEKTAFTKLLWVFLGISCIALMGACNNESGEKEKPANVMEKNVVGVLVYKADDPYLQSVTKVIKQSLGDEVTVIVKYAEDDQFTQNEQIDNFIAEKVNGLIINLVEPSSAETTSVKTQKSNIPVIFFNREPDLSTLENYENTYFVGTIIEHAGVLQGDMIAKLWNDNPLYDKNKDGIIQYVMIQANPDSAESVARTEFSVKQAIKNGIKLEQVGATLMCAWSEDLAAQDFSQAWPTIGNQVELVISNNDTMGLGVIKVLQANGYNLGTDDSPYIPVIGVDGIAQAVEAIDMGIMSGTVKQNASLMGKAIANIMLSSIAGKPIVQDDLLQWSASGKVVRIPYSLLSRETQINDK